MFFADRIHFSSTDRVLEVGPGATPHPGSQIFLERRFADFEAFRQRGGLPAIELKKPVIYYGGDRFPFGDQEFDYVICSHVLEHVEHPEKFLQELARVAPRGYLEFPTVYYEYLYNFREHLNLVVHKDGELLWMPKRESTLSEFDPIQQFLRATLEAGYGDILQLKESFFQGFEWTESIRARRVNYLSELVPPTVEIKPPNKPPEPSSRTRLVDNVLRKLSRRIKKFLPSL
jgi:SAM-dependent methyltransferase